MNAANIDHTMVTSIDQKDGTASRLTDQPRIDREAGQMTYIRPRWRRPSNPTTYNNSSTILYSLYALFSLFSGSIVNFPGSRLTLASGGIVYTLYASYWSYWSYNHTANKGFMYFAGAACGIAAAFLWSAEGAMILSLPIEKDKGGYICFLRIEFLYYDN